MAQATKQVKRSKSVLRRQRQTITKTKHNKRQTSSFRTELKKILEQVKSGAKEAAGIASPAVHTIIDKAKSKGVISKNAATRYKSRIDNLINHSSDQPLNEDTNMATAAKTTKAKKTTTAAKTTKKVTKKAVTKKAPAKKVSKKK